MKRPLLLLLVNIFLQVHLIGQMPTIQDCLGAIPICNFGTLLKSINQVILVF